MGNAMDETKPGDLRLSADLDNARLLQRLTPRGRHAIRPLRSLLQSGTVEKANRSIPPTDEQRFFLYIPEYAGSRVTATLEEQTVNPRAVYRLSIDPLKAN